MSVYCSACAMEYFFSLFGAYKYNINKNIKHNANRFLRFLLQHAVQNDFKKYILNNIV
jgi:hypothetical protein